jgi:hypothetical protein
MRARRAVQSSGPAAALARRRKRIEVDVEGAAHPGVDLGLRRHEALDAFAAGPGLPHRGLWCGHPHLLVQGTLGRQRWQGRQIRWRWGGIVGRHGGLLTRTARHSGAAMAPAPVLQGKGRLSSSHEFRARRGAHPPGQRLRLFDEFVQATVKHPTPPRCAAWNGASPSGCRSSPATGARSRAARARSASGWRGSSSTCATSRAGWMDLPHGGRCRASPAPLAAPSLRPTTPPAAGRRRALHRRPGAHLLPAPPAARPHAAARPAGRGADAGGRCRPGRHTHARPQAARRARRGARRSAAARPGAGGRPHAVGPSASPGGAAEDQALGTPGVAGVPQVEDGCARSPSSGGKNHLRKINFCLS